MTSPLVHDVGRNCQVPIVAIPLRGAQHTECAVLPALLGGLNLCVDILRIKIHALEQPLILNAGIDPQP